MSMKPLSDHPPYRRPDPGSDPCLNLGQDLERALVLAREESHRHFGKTLDFYLPGMFWLDGETGLYPAVSLTGGRCDLGCEHCRSRMLRTMVPALTPESLIEAAMDFKARGRLGMLVSGGSDPDGRLPWPRFTCALETIVDRIGLVVTVHAGYLTGSTARALKAAGVRQALVDVIGDDVTAREVYHLARGTSPVWETMDALAEAGLETAPHLVAGLYFGKIQGEYEALRRLADYRPSRLVTVVLNPLKGTPMEAVRPPDPLDVAWLLAEARRLLPAARHHLGCARPRGVHRRVLDRLAVRAGINALALPGDSARAEASLWGLNTTFTKTCCSLAGSAPTGRADADPTMERAKG